MTSKQRLNIVIIVLVVAVLGFGVVTADGWIVAAAMLLLFSRLVALRKQTPRLIPVPAKKDRRRIG